MSDQVPADGQPEVSPAAAEKVSTPAQDATLLERDPVRGQEGHRRPGPDDRADAGRPCSPAGTACSRACPAWPRRSPWRPWPRWSAARSPGIQFTPDLVPADIMGTRIYRPSSEKFDVELGPVFVNFLLADEINRAPAKVQSALLEVMAEQQVSIGGKTYEVPDAVPGHGHPEPDRAGGRLPAARGPARPVPAQDRRGLPDRHRGAGDRLPGRGTHARRRPRCSTRRS